MQYFLIVILIALSAFFSGSEISYASLNGMRMKNAAENGAAKISAPDAAARIAVTRFGSPFIFILQS